MPQPLRRATLVGFTFNPNRLLERPKLAANVARVSGWWNEIEARTSAFLAAILESEAETVIAIFLALQNDGAKKAMIDTIVSLKLTPDETVRFQEIQKMIGARYSERNRAVHGAWGLSDEYPDALLWMDTRYATNFHSRMMKLKNPEDQRARDALMLEAQENILIWKEQDFNATVERLITAWTELANFTQPIMQKRLGPWLRFGEPPPEPPLESVVPPDQDAG
jgi:hypothetical protein